MIEKDLADLTCEFMMLLTNIFFKREISLETYICDTNRKISFLEAFIQSNTDYCQNIRIIKTIIQHKIILNNKKSIPAIL